MKRLPLLGILLLGLAACGQAGDPQAATAVSTSEEQAIQQPTDEPTIPSATVPAPEAQPAAADSATVAAPTPEPAAPTTVPTGGPIAVTYFTPAQQEGPYYTLDKPADRDNDLVDLAGAADLAAGQIIEFGGRVYNAGGLPAAGLTIEIWQTDANGVYLHPGDPDTEARDRNFQFYGEAITDSSGRYSFRTILPGEYEPRPAHIHFKVKREGQELLTSQFYFSGDPDSAGIDPALLITAVPGEDGEGGAILTGERDIVLNME